MKVLIVGNSQAGALKRSYDRAADDIRAAGLDIYFYVIPGGMGPDLGVAEGRLTLGQVSQMHPPYMAPAGTDQMPLADFDVIVMSALGYFDGGFAYRNPITVSGVLAEFGPKGPAAQRAPVSDRCFAEMMRDLLERQPGIRALRAIATAFSGPVYIQPFPEISEALPEHEDWGLATWYDAPIEAYRFMAERRDESMRDIAIETGAELLETPDFGHPQGLTPHPFMREDCVHQSDDYGALMLTRLRDRLLAT